MRSALSKLCGRLRRGMSRVCLVVGGALVVLAVASILLPLLAGVMLLALAQRVAEREAESRSVIVVPAGAA